MRNRSFNFLSSSEATRFTCAEWPAESVLCAEQASLCVVEIIFYNFGDGHASVGLKFVPFWWVKCVISFELLRRNKHLVIGERTSRLKSLYSQLNFLFENYDIYLVTMPHVKYTQYIVRSIWCNTLFRCLTMPEGPHKFYTIAWNISVKRYKIHKNFLHKCWVSSKICLMTTNIYLT